MSWTKRCRRSLLFLLVAALPIGAALPAQQLNHPEFVRKFKEARELNDEPGVIKCLKDMPGEAIHHFEQRLDEFVHAGNNDSGNTVQKMRELWPKAHNGSQLFDKLERFRSGLDPTEINRLNKLVSQENVAWKIFESAKEKNNEREFRQAIDALRQIAQGIDEIGDKLRAAKSWLLLVNVIEKFPERNRGDVELQVRAMETYLQHHEDWDWKSRDYALNKSWYPGLKRRLEEPKPEEGAKGKPGEDGKPGAPGDASAEGLLPFKPGSAWVTAPLAHTPLKKPIEGIILYASADPFYWPAVGLRGSNAPQALPLFKDGTLELERAAANKYLAKGGPNLAKREIKLNGEKPTEVWYEKGGVEVNFDFFLWTGSNQEQFAGGQFNMAPSWRPSDPDGTFAGVRHRSASAFTGELGDTKITFYDDTANGIFLDLPTAGQALTGDYRLGLGFEVDKEQAKHPIFDSMQVAGSKHVVPASSWVHAGESWYSIKILGNNQKLSFRELDPERVKTGRIALKWKGSKKAHPQYLVVVEPSKQIAFDVANGGSKGVEVPAGTYEIHYGRIVNGRRPRNMNAVILKGESKSFEVKPGETHTLELGAPFFIDCVATTGDKIEVSTNKMWVTDKSGVRYTCIEAEVLEPELIVARNDKGSGAKVLAEWRRLSGQEVSDIQSKYKGVDGIALAMYACNKEDIKQGCEVSVENPYKGGQSFVGVRQKKHKLFGELKPIWK